MVAKIQTTVIKSAAESIGGILTDTFTVTGFANSALVLCVGGYRWNSPTVLYPSFTNVRWEPDAGANQDFTLVNSNTASMSLVRYDIAGYMGIRSSIYILRNPTTGPGNVWLNKTATYCAAYSRTQHVSGISTDQDFDTDKSDTPVAGSEVGGVLDAAGGYSASCCMAFYGPGSFGSPPTNEYPAIYNQSTEHGTSGAFTYPVTFSDYSKIFAHNVAWWEPAGPSGSRPLFAEFGGI